MKRFFLIFFFVTINLIAFAVDNLFDGSTDSNWGTAANWSQDAVPTATDGFITRFDATSPNCTINTNNRVADNIDFTGYTNTIAWNFRLTVSGDITLDAGMTITGTGGLWIATVGNINFAGKTFPNDFVVSASTATITLLSDLNITGGMSAGVTTATTAINGAYNIYVGGNLTISITSGTVTGNASFIMNGTGTVSTPNATTGSFRNNLTFNTADTIIIGTLLQYKNGTITNTAGTITTTGSTLSIMGNVTLNLSNLTLNNLSISTASAVLTLSSGFKLSGQLASTVTGSSIVSNSAGTQRKLTMLATSTQSISATNNIDATDIDSGDGLPIVSDGAVLSNTLNWYNSTSYNNMFMAW
jgi:hypothetical protein